MSKFERATPRPWKKDQRGHLYGFNGNRVTVYDLGAALAMSSPSDEERDNAKLFLAAVNAYDALIMAASNAKDLIERVGDHRKDAWLIEQLDEALKLARGEQ